MLSIKISYFTSLLVSILTIQVTAGQDITCDDCIAGVGGLKDALLFNNRYKSNLHPNIMLLFFMFCVFSSLASEEKYILTEICPGAGLGDEDAHPNCEK